MTGEFEYNPAAEFAQLAFLKMYRAFRQETTAFVDPIPKGIHFSKDVLKAAVPAASTENTAEAIDFANPMGVAFVTSPFLKSAFARIYNDRAFFRTDAHQKFAVNAFVPVGTGVDEKKYAPIYLPAFTGDRMKRRKGISLFTATNEFLKTVGADGVNYLGQQLRNGVDLSLDREFIPEVFDAADTMASTGSGASAIMGDIEALLNAVKTAGSLYFLADPETANILATARTSEGIPIFPEAGPTGGAILNTPMIVSQQVPTDTAGGTLLLVNAARIAAFLEGATLETSTSATLQFSSTPLNTSDVNYNRDLQVLNLFQADMQALKCLVSFGFELGDADGTAAAITGIARETESA